MNRHKPIFEKKIASMIQMCLEEIETGRETFASIVG